MGHAVNEDRFRLVVDGKDCPIASSYTVGAGVFDVPAAFEMTVGHNGLLTELLHSYCEFTPFELFVNDVKVMRGEIDDLSSAPKDGTELSIKGRDRLKRLVDSEHPSDETFTDVTFTDITERALAAVGLGEVSLVSSNLANLKAITGTTKITEEVPSNEEQTDTEIATTVQTRTRTVHKSLSLDAGSTWWDFLLPQYQRGGLFLWAGVLDEFVLGQPNGKQAPMARILRRRTGKGESGEVTILGQPSFGRTSKPRYSEIHVLGRKGSGADGRGKALARVLDPEMVALLNPNPADQANGGKLKKIKTYRDDKVKTPSQAAFFALRKLAESRRNGFTLKYPVSGHTVDAISGGGRLVWQPDMVVHVIDDELGIDGPMYVDDCQYSRAVNGLSVTMVSVMRPEDLVFGEEDLLAAPPQRKKGLVRMGRTEVFRPRWLKDPNWGNLPTWRGVHVGPDGFTFVVDDGVERRR